LPFLEDHLRTILLTPKHVVKVEIVTEGDDGRLLGIEVNQPPLVPAIMFSAGGL
jgi:hypothetical protein